MSAPSSSFEVQAAIVAVLEIAGVMPVAEIPVLRRRPKEKESDIQAAIAKAKICVYVMPPDPTHALQGTPFLFYDSYEIRLRIVEQTPINDTGTDAYEVSDSIAQALHYAPHRHIEAAVQAAMTANSIDQEAALALVRQDPKVQPYFTLAQFFQTPIQIAQRPFETVEDPKLRIRDAVFIGQLQVNAET